MILATFVTLVGGGLIALVAPTPEEIERERHGTWIVHEDDAEGPPAKAERPPGPE